MTGSGTDKKLIGKTILVAEDVEMNQQLICHILGHLGAKVEVAANGEEALRKIKSRLYDCVLMDVQMPEMDGIQATREIRSLEDPQASQVPVIALTANADPEDLQRYEQAGMNDYLAKPFGETQLLEAILSNICHSSSEQEMSSDKLYDLTMIRSVSGGDPAFIKKMILLFIDTVPQNVRDLVDATGKQNWEQAAKMAHKLKSTVDSMGIRSIHDLIREVEQNAKQGSQLEQMPGMVNEVETVVSNCIDQLRGEVG